MTEAYLKQYVEVARDEPARLAAETCSQACRSGVSVVAVEALMNNVGYSRMQKSTECMTDQ